MAAYLIWGLGLAAFWVPLMLLGLAWQSHNEGLEDLGWLQTVCGPGSPPGLRRGCCPWAGRRSWGSELLYGGGGLGKLPRRGCCCSSLNPIGAALALGLVLLISFMGATRLSYVGLMALLGQGVRSRLAAGCGAGRKRSCRRRRPTTPRRPKPWGARSLPRQRERAGSPGTDAAAAPSCNSDLGGRGR